MSRLRPERSGEVRESPTHRPSAELGVPQILWPSIEYRRGIENRDLPRFPDRNQVVERYRKGTARKDLALKTFEAAIGQSLDHILVLDPHFDEFGVNALVFALASSQAGDIRLLTGGSGTGERSIAELKDTLTQFRNMNRSGSSLAEVRWSSRLDRYRFPFLHDRFAIVDGALWHFGATVGGGHPGLTAASGPWSEAETRARRFFEECWSTCNA